MDKRTLLKLDRLLKKFPEVWMHTTETGGSGNHAKKFHHVDYKSTSEGKPKVRLVSYVSADMSELLVRLKTAAPELIEIARASLIAEKPEPGRTRNTRQAKRGPNV